MRVDERVFSNLVSPYDVRDYRIAVGANREFPEAFELPLVTVKNQGSTGSCVAHACSSVVEFHNKRQEGTDIVFSTEFIYGYRPFGYYVGTGMYIRNALKTLSKLGDCPLVHLRGNHEYKEAMEIVESKLEELREHALPHRISTYVKVDTIDEIKQALMDFGYVVVSMPWYKDYKLKNGVYSHSSKETRGYHCMFIYGWNESGWLVQNSWGRDWGRDGRFIMPFDFKWQEAWAVSDNNRSGDVIIPQEHWFIKLFGGVINSVVNFFRKLFKKA